jgi:hypothetical protein
MSEEEVTVDRALAFTALMRNMPNAMILQPFLSPRAVKVAAEIEAYYCTAQAIGVSREDAERLLTEARQDHLDWEWSFNPTEEARRRLMEQYAALRTRPAVELRSAARKVLAYSGSPYTPADVDQLARNLEAFCQPGPTPPGVGHDCPHESIEG